MRKKEEEYIPQFAEITARYENEAESQVHSTLHQHATYTYDELYDACKEQDSKSNDIIDKLWKWAKTLDSLSLILSLLVLGGGILYTSVNTLFVTELVEKNVLISMFTLITSVLPWIASAFGTYITLYLASLLIKALASIVQNTKISANIALYQAEKQQDNK